MSNILPTQNTGETQSVQGFIEFMVKAIVTEPTGVMVEQNMNSFDETYVIHVSATDMGILIGKGGKNINAIRNLISIKSAGKKIFIQAAEIV